VPASGSARTVGSNRQIGSGTLDALQLVGGRFTVAW
jgi:hypothetical protein